MTPDLFDIMGGDDARKPRNGGVTVDTIDLEMVLHYDNDARKAILVSDTGDARKAVWLPKSQIEFSDTGKTCAGVTAQGQIVTLPVVSISVPEWLAKEKGLV